MTWGCVRAGPPLNFFFSDTDVSGPGVKCETLNELEWGVRAGYYIIRSLADLRRKVLNP